VVKTHGIVVTNANGGAAVVGEGAVDDIEGGVAQRKHASPGAGFVVREQTVEELNPGAPGNVDGIAVAVVGVAAIEPVALEDGRSGSDADGATAARGQAVRKLAVLDGDAYRPWSEDRTAVAIRTAVLPGGFAALEQTAPDGEGVHAVHRCAVEVVYALVELAVLDGRRAPCVDGVRDVHGLRAPGVMESDPPDGARQANPSAKRLAVDGHLPGTRGRLEGNPLGEVDLPFVDVTALDPDRVVHRYDVGGLGQGLEG